MLHADYSMKFDLTDLDPRSMDYHYDAISQSASPNVQLSGRAEAIIKVVEEEVMYSGIPNRIVDRRLVSVEWKFPILVQAKWHKKPRIRKKWLKRYGYKEDELLVRMPDAVAVFNLETGEFQFDGWMVEFVYRSDQMRRGLAIVKTWQVKQQLEGGYVRLDKNGKRHRV